MDLNEPSAPAEAPAEAPAVETPPVEAPPVVPTVETPPVEAPAEAPLLASVSHTPPPPPPNAIPNQVAEAETHPSFEILKSGRMNGLKKKADRIKILLDVVAVEPTSKILATEVLKNAHEFIRNCKTRTLWNNESVATALCTLDMFRQDSRKARAESRPPKAVKTFDLYMEVAASCATTKKQNNTSKVTGEQKGIPVQYTIKFDPTRLATHACPACGHSNVVEIGMNNTDINEYNKIKQAEQNAVISDWRNLSKAQRGTRPSAPHYKCQEYACYCCISYCNGRNDGGNCRLCIAGYKHSKDGKRGAHGKNPFLRDDMTCSCALCNCVCSIRYRANDREKIALHNELKRREEAATKETGGAFRIGECGVILFCVVVVALAHPLSVTFISLTCQDDQETMLETFMTGLQQTGSKMYSQMKMEASSDTEASQMMFSSLAHSLNQPEHFENNELRSRFQELNNGLTDKVGGKRIRELQSVKRERIKQAKKAREMDFLSSPSPPFCASPSKATKMSSFTSPAKMSSFTSPAAMSAPSPSVRELYVDSSDDELPPASPFARSVMSDPGGRFYRNRLEYGGMNALLGDAGHQSSPQKTRDLSMKERIVNYLLKNTAVVGTKKIGILIGVVSDQSNTAAKSVIDGYEMMTNENRPDIKTIVDTMIQLFAGDD